jgi:hypothetical protein
MVIVMPDTTVILTSVLSRADRKATEAADFSLK